MANIDQRIKRQMKFLSIAVILLIVLVSANFYIAFALPHERTETIVGPIGPQGALGLRGERGDKGDRGEPGPLGLSGREGASGANGVNGFDGLPGKDGADGKDGLNGTNGVDGRTPEFACIEGAISWKYTDEQTWRPLYGDCEPPEEVVAE